jgi:hypothetical protein
MLIYTDGLERSGNVFISHAISLITGKEVKSVRSHNINTLQDYKEKYPFVVPVRDALPSIASAKIYRDKSFLDHPERMARHAGTDAPDEYSLQIENIIQRFLDYTQYLVDNPRFFVAPFDEFTKDATSVMYKLSKRYPRITILNNVTNQDIEDSCSLGENMFHTEAGNLPRPTPKKAEMEEMLKSQFFIEIQAVQTNVDKLHKRYDALL